MLVCSVQIISLLDNQSSKCLHYLHYVPAAILVYWPTEEHQHGGSIHACGGNIFANISTLGQRTPLILGKLSSLIIFYNITISWLYLLNGFKFNKKQHTNCSDKHDKKPHVGKQNYLTWRFVCFDIHLQKWPFIIRVTTKFKFKISN